MSPPEPTPAAAVIRRAVPGDADALRSVILPGWRAAYLAATGEDNLARMAALLLDRDSLLRLIGDPGACVALALACGEAAATALARSRGGRVHLHRLYVLEKFQRRGFGLALLEYAAAAFPSCSGMTLNVEAGNAAALAFYESLGFRQTGEGREDVAGVNFPVRTLER